MKTVIFTQEQWQDLDRIGQSLFDDAQDPRSASYVRVLNRPRIRWGRIALCLLLPLVVAVGAVAVLRYVGLSTVWAVLIAVAALLVYALLMSKRAAICVVKIYQRYAPDAVRNKCRFEPSCSEYMILSIEKYGLIKGLSKGIDRLKRCNIDDGGFDLP